MQNSRFQSITSRFSPHNLRTSFRRSMSSSSSRSSSMDRGSLASSHTSGSPVGTIGGGGVFSRKSSSLLEPQDEAERPPHILEPRPAATFCSLEERMMSF